MDVEASLGCNFMCTPMSHVGESGIIIFLAFYGSSVLISTVDVPVATTCPNSGV